MLHHLAGATIEVANLVNYNCLLKKPAVKGYGYTSMSLRRHKT